MILPIARLFFIISLFVGVHSLEAQNERTIPYFWLSSGVGGTSVQNGRPEFSLGFSANMEWKKQMFGLRHLRSKEFILFATPLQVNETALYWGKYFLGNEDNSFASLGLGPSIETYYTLGASKPSNSSGGFGSYHYLESNVIIGVALDIQAGVNFGRYVGLGVHGFASLNTKKTIAGALLSLRLGNLGEK